jgi:hypothetical protein
MWRSGNWEKRYNIHIALCKVTIKKSSVYMIGYVYCVCNFVEGLGVYNKCWSLFYSRKQGFFQSIIPVRMRASNFCIPGDGFCFLFNFFIRVEANIFLEIHVMYFLPHFPSYKRHFPWKIFPKITPRLNTEWSIVNKWAIKFAQIPC